MDEDEEAELFDEDDEDNGETERLEDSDDNSQNSDEPDEFTEYLLGQEKIVTKNSETVECLTNIFHAKLLEILGRVSDSTCSIKDEAYIACQILKSIGQNMDSSVGEEQATSIQAALENFLISCAKSILSCYDKISTLKIGIQRKQVRLEQEFSKARVSDESINTAWACLLNEIKITNLSGSGVVLQHILQYFWSTLTFSDLRKVYNKVANEESCINDKLLSAGDEHINQKTDEAGHAAILYHAGWVLKRVREDCKAGEEKVALRVKPGVENFINVTKEEIMSTISLLGTDEKDLDNGKFHFRPNVTLLSFFMMLHEKSKFLLKGSIQDINSSAVIETMKKLIVDSELRGNWQKSVKLLGSEVSDGAVIILLKHVVWMFLKSKQARVREQMELKPDKQSKATRQGGIDASSKKGKGKNTPLTNTKKPSKSSKTSEEVLKIRKNFKSPSELLDILTERSINEDKLAVFSELNGDELVKLLKAFGKPCYQGKAKTRQCEKLAEAILEHPLVFKYPEKVIIKQSW